MNSLKSHSIYHSRKRIGILFFALLIFGCTLAMMWYEPEHEVIIGPEEKERVLAFQQEIDSLKLLEIERRKPKIYPFNPTLLTDFNGYKLGMTAEEIDRVVRFRESGKWFNSTAEFQKVSRVSDSLLATISPYFKWPKWMTEKKSKPYTKYSSKKKWKTDEEKGKLNSLSYEDLLNIEGMDEASATKISQHLKKTGGYQVDNQIYDVYGVTTKVKRLVLNDYTVKEKPSIDLINVNTASASDLATVPLLTFDIAKEIVDYRILREGIKSLEELKNLDGMTDYKYDRIKLYLHVD